MRAPGTFPGPRTPSRAGDLPRSGLASQAPRYRPPPPDRLPRPRPEAPTERSFRRSRPSRSLSLTRSSPTCRNVVIPCRPGGEHRQQRDLVDESGDLPAPAPRLLAVSLELTRRSPTGSPKRVARSRPSPEHPFARAHQEAGAGWVDAHPGNPELAGLGQHRGAHQKCRR